MEPDPLNPPTDTLDDLATEFQSLTIDSTPNPTPKPQTPQNPTPPPTPKTPLYKVGVVTNSKMLLHWPDHKNQESHPENPRRLSYVLDFLQKKKIREITDYIDTYSLCTESYINLGYSMHSGPVSPTIYDKMKNLFLDTKALENSKKGKKKKREKSDEKNNKDLSTEVVSPDGGDTYINSSTFDAMLYSCSAVKECVDRILAKTWDTGFALIRPPGHHSPLDNKPQGFCFLNNVALATNYLRREKGVKKILIFDWDVHHGNGTQDFFEGDENVMFVSLHEYDNGEFYPHSKYGGMGSVGSGGGRFKKINFAWDIRAVAEKKRVWNRLMDDDYLFVVESVLLPIIREFAPEFIFISAGFDSCIGDTIGDFHCTPGMFAKIAVLLRKICRNVVVASEGGYTYENLANCTYEILKSLAFKNVDQTPEISQPQAIRDKYFPQTFVFAH